MNVNRLIEFFLKAKEKMLSSEVSEYVDEFDKKRHVGIDFGEACKNLAKSGNYKALLCLLDSLDTGWGYGETIQTEIVENFSEKQLINALYDKFDQIARYQFEREVYIINMLILRNDASFEKFRKVFNHVRSKASGKFLDNLLNWRPNKKNYIDLLREDMKKW